MRIAFAGTPLFARQALAALREAGHEVVLVLTQPDRPAGRGQRLQASPVKQYAVDQGLTLAQPRSLRLDGRFADAAASARDALQAAAPELMVVAAYGLILPPWALQLPPRGCLNIHASLLPRWRGAAPIQRAIEAGDARTGITIMQMDAGLDTGPMLLREALAIDAAETAATLYDRLAALGARLIVMALASIDTLQPELQPEVGVTYADKIDKAEGVIDWRLPAAQIERRVRAFDPFPGMVLGHAEQAIKVWRAAVVDAPGGVRAAPGTVLESAPGTCRVACGEGALDLLELQRAGARREPVRQFLQAHALPPGTRLALCDGASSPSAAGR